MAASQFAGAAGQYHVTYCLSVRNIHAAITLSNAPDIDVLASNIDGSRLLSIQVKTSRRAYRKNRYGFEVCEWDVNARIIDRGSPSLWFAFVDLQENEGALESSNLHRALDVGGQLREAGLVEEDVHVGLSALGGVRRAMGPGYKVSGGKRCRDRRVVRYCA